MAFQVDPPMAIEVRMGPDGAPCHIRGEPLMGDVRPVQHWLAEVDWWSRPVTREYWRVLLRERLLCEIYHDRDQDAWFVERIYD
jgi:hypothetical protein